MASESQTSTRPLNPSSVRIAHNLIISHIHHTPVQTNTTISDIASTPQTAEALQGTQWEGTAPASPKMRLFFKCENFQRIGAFKARGAFHAVLRLVEEFGLKSVQGRGVVTHSSGNHAQALALAAKTFSIPAHIVMPTISTSSKIEGTRAQGANIHFSGSTSQEREAMVTKVQEETGAILVPPYNHPDIMLGQGTAAMEFKTQVEDLLAAEKEGTTAQGKAGSKKTGLDAVIAPCGGGGLLSGTAISLHDTSIRVFGSEPSFQGADDARRGLESGSRVTSVKTLTIADGLRTPLGPLTWNIISDKSFVSGIYSVTEEQILAAMRLVLERMKCFVEPSSVVPLAVALFNEDFRRMVEKEGGKEGWNLGIVFSGGNTTIEAIGKLFAVKDKEQENLKREEGTVGTDGKKIAENVAG